MLMVVPLTTMACTLRSPSFTVAPDSNPVPVMVPHAPPWIEPTFGLMAATVGRIPVGWGLGCGAGWGEGDCGTTEGANGVDIESEPPQPVNPCASTKNTIPARVLLINAVSS